MLLAILRGILWIVLNFSAYLMEQANEENEIRTPSKTVVQHQNPVTALPKPWYITTNTVACLTL
jgi:hypothetical protein